MSRAASHASQQRPPASVEHGREMSRQKLRSRAKEEDESNARRLLDGTLAGGGSADEGSAARSSAQSPSRKTKLADFLTAQPASSLSLPSPIPELAEVPTAVIPEPSQAPDASPETKVRRLGAREAADRALAKVQLVVQFMNLQRYDETLFDLRQAKSALPPPVIDLRNELQRRFVPPDIKPSQYFTSALAQVNNIIDSFNDEDIPTDAALDEEEAQVLRDTAAALKRKKMTMSHCSCRQGLDKVLADAENIATVKAREDSSKAFAKMIAGSVTMIRAMELNLEDRDKQIRELTVASSTLTKQVAALKADLEKAQAAAGSATSSSHSVTQQDLSLLNHSAFLDRELRLFNALKRLKAGGVKMNVNTAVQREFGKDADANAPWVAKFLRRTQTIQELRNKLRASESELMAAFDTPARSSTVEKGMQTLKEEDIVGTKAWEKKQGAQKAARAAAIAMVTPTQPAELIVPTLFDAATEVRTVVNDSDLPMRIADPLISVLLAAKEFMAQIDQCRVESLAGAVEVMEPRLQARTLQTCHFWQVQLDSALRDALDGLRPALRQLGVSIKEVVGNARREAARTAAASVQLANNKPQIAAGTPPPSREIAPAPPVATAASDAAEPSLPRTPVDGRRTVQTLADPPESPPKSASSKARPIAVETSVKASAAVPVATALPVAVPPTPSTKKKNTSDASAAAAKPASPAGNRKASPSQPSGSGAPSRTKQSAAAQGKAAKSGGGGGGGGGVMGGPVKPTKSNGGESSIGAPAIHNDQICTYPGQGDCDSVASDVNAEDDMPVACVDAHVQASVLVCQASVDTADGPENDPDDEAVVCRKGDMDQLVQSSVRALNAVSALLLDVRSRLGVLLPRDVLADLSGWDGGRKLSSHAANGRRGIAVWAPWPQVPGVNTEMQKLCRWVEGAADGLALLEPPVPQPMTSDHATIMSASLRIRGLCDAAHGTADDAVAAPDCCGTCGQSLVGRAMDPNGFESIDAALNDNEPDPFDNPASASVLSTGMSRVLAAAAADTLASAAASTPRSAAPGVGKIHPSQSLVMQAVANARASAAMLISCVADVGNKKRTIGPVPFEIVEQVANAATPISESLPLSSAADIINQTSNWLDTLCRSVFLEVVRDVPTHHAGMGLPRGAATPKASSKSGSSGKSMPSSALQEDLRLCTSDSALSIASPLSRPAQQQREARPSPPVSPATTPPATTPRAAVVEQALNAVRASHRFALVALDALHIDLDTVSEPARGLLAGHEAAVTPGAAEVLMTILFDLVSSRIPAAESSMIRSDNAIATAARVRHLENVVAAAQASTAELTLEMEDLRSERDELLRVVQQQDAAMRSTEALSRINSRLRAGAAPMAGSLSVADTRRTTMRPARVDEEPSELDAADSGLHDEQVATVLGSQASFKLSAAPPFTTLPPVDKLAGSRKVTPTQQAQSPPPAATVGTHIELFPRPANISRGSLGQWSTSKPATPITGPSEGSRPSLPSTTTAAPPPIREAKVTPPAVAPTEPAKAAPNAHAVLTRPGPQPAQPHAIVTTAPLRTDSDDSLLVAKDRLGKPCAARLPPRPVPAPAPPPTLLDQPTVVERDLLDLVDNLSAAERIVFVHRMLGPQIIRLHDTVHVCVKLATQRLKLSAVMQAAEPLEKHDAAMRQRGEVVDLEEVLEHDRMVLQSLSELLVDDSHAAVAKIQRTFERVKCRIMRRKVDDALKRAMNAPAHAAAAANGYQMRRDTEFLLRQRQRLDEHARWLDEQRTKIIAEQMKRRREWRIDRPSSRDAPLFTTTKVILRARDGAQAPAQGAADAAAARPASTTIASHGFPTVNISADAYTILFQQKVRQWLNAKKSLFDRRRRAVGSPPTSRTLQFEQTFDTPWQSQDAIAMMRHAMQTPSIQVKRPLGFTDQSSTPQKYPVALTPPPSAAAEAPAGLEPRSGTPPPPLVTTHLAPLRHAAVVQPSVAPPPGSFVDLTQRTFKSLKAKVAPVAPQRTRYV